MPSYLITGASRGIGLEFVRQLSADPQNTVFAVVRNEKTADRLLAIRTTNVHILEADITDHVALKKAAHETAKVTGGSLDVLINNAAFVSYERTELPLDGYEDQNLLADDLRLNFNVNVIGVIFTINAFLPLLKRGTTKKVITISSAVGDPEFVRAAKGLDSDAPYAISKAAVNLANAKYAVEYENEGFTFVALSPGLVNTSTGSPTDADLELYNKMIAGIKKIVPEFERPLTPEESVKLQLEVIKNVTVKDSGTLISHHGDKNWL